MKREYYHFYPTCPSCLEPFSNGLPIKTIEMNKRKCTSCKTFFYSSLDLTVFENTTKELINRGQSIGRIAKVPVLWKINPNIIEKSYIEWIKSFPKGNYIITWPWKKVKFIPILASEYNLKNPRKTVVIIGDITKNETNDFYYPDLSNVFDNLIYLKNPEDNLDRAIKTERNSFKEKDILISKKKRHYEISRGHSKIIKGSEIMTGFSDKRVDDCVSDLKEYLEDNYGSKAVKTVTINGKPETINTNGIFNIKIKEQDSKGNNLKFNKDGLWKVLFNKIYRLKVACPLCYIFPKENLEIDEKAEIYLISDTIHSKKIFDFILELNPGLVIVENIDSFTKDISWGKISKNLFNFLNKTESSVLLFSSNPRMRYLLKINYPDSPLNQIDLNFHTWDSGEIMDFIKPKFENNNKKNTPVSSLPDELLSYGHKPQVEYIHIDTLNEIDELISKLELSKNYIQFLEDLKKSPLMIKGNYDKPEFLMRKYKYGSEIHYEKFTIEIRQKCPELYKKTIELFNNIYSTNKKIQKNPLMEKIIELLDNLVKDEMNVISILIHGFDLKGTESILAENGFSEWIPHRIAACTWKTLGLRESEIDKNKKHVVISTRIPSFDYQVYFTKNIEKFIFLGSDKDIQMIDSAIKDRWTEIRYRPLVQDVHNAPDLLKDALKNISETKDVESSDVEIESKIELKKFIKFHQTEEELENAENKNHHKLIKSGEESLMVSNESDKIMFLPLNKYIFFRDENGKIEEIKIEESKINKIENKSIITDRSGIYTSFKQIFTKFMIEDSQNIDISGVFSWNTFSGLLKDATEWISLLRYAQKRIIEEEKISKGEADEKLAIYLSELDLNAKRKDYIKKWWSNPDIVLTEFGPIPVYDIERPKSHEDLIKIYKGIKKLFPDLKLEIKNAERSFVAAKALQKLRRTLLRNQINELSLRHRSIHKNLENEINNIIEDSETFKITAAVKVKLTEDVNSLKAISHSEGIKYILQE